MSLPTPAGRYLSAEDLEVVYDQKKFQDAAEIDDVHLLHFKHDRTLFVRVPVNSSDQNPHDGYIWGQTKYGKDRVVVFRHQPTRKIIELYGAKCTSLNCTELNQPHIRNQIFQYQDQIYCYYFTTTDEPISIPSEGLFPVKKKRLTKNCADILTRLVIPGRTVKQALSTAREMGMTDVTKKQVLNVSRRCVDCVFTKNGPRARSSLAMAEKIKQENPDLTWFEQTNNVLTEFTSIRVFKDACKIFYEGCPPLDEWEAYTELVEDMINDKNLRESELPKLYDHYPNGVFFPSRLHVDTTYRLSDMYITVVLGETGNFLTKPSGKARVIPLLYMLHSSRSRITHEKAALALKEALMEHSNPFSPKKFPCLLLDGEEALQVYGETLNAEVIRCDVHLLSVIRYNHGGKAAADAAKPFLFGRMKEGTWHAGILGCFSLSSFNRRVEKCKNKLDPLVYDWIVSNKQMLMQYASSAAKLRSGHLIQFSTNNTNETFNKHIKANLTKMHSASQLIQKIDHFVSDSLKECWLSSIGASDCVKLKVDISTYTENQKLSHYKEIGLSGYIAMGLGCPRSLANGLLMIDLFYASHVVF
ncbi:hypothetical protein GCK72_012561 [Caenorhabditis remanei]|uniref:Uncharacterized protein n=1 Tax=Caenorhabditis remanei TaxID=31234 RepID=A0A6A5GL97_CAERE|nr:hypothetical protein GCK72_012561 [Caenorhabditis remanei]KAF1756108.1 hypothetical protein GCK72_012561 [Caenorhabditis remanei]